MPVYLKEVNDYSILKQYDSVLIVPCRFCPAASMAVRKKAPYIDLTRNFLKTDSYEQLIKDIVSNLENMEVKTEIFNSNLPHQFTLCMWTPKRREKLKERAAKHDALLVLGCEAAVETVCDSIKSTTGKVYQGMRSEGIMSVRPHFRLPCNISLELNTITPLLHQASASNPWICL